MKAQVDFHAKSGCKINCHHWLLLSFNSLHVNIPIF